MPPVDTLDLNPTIKLIFQGLIVTHIKDDEQIAQIGAVVSDDCHRPKVTVTRKKNGKYLDEVNISRLLDIQNNLFEEDIFLDVEDTTRTVINTFQKGQFDRSDDEAGDRHDFRWFVDLERDIFEGIPLEIDKSQIKPVFHVQSAVFYAVEPTKDPLVLRHEDGTQTKFGHVTEAIAANVTLDRLHSKAVLRVGDQEILEINAVDVVNGITYEIMFDCECPVAPAPQVTAAADLVCGDEPPPPPSPPPSDFVKIFNAVGTNLTDSQKVDLQAEEVEPAQGGGTLPRTDISFNPQVYCSGANTGGSLR